MSKILLFICVFFTAFTFAQCSLEISDTTHVNCFGESTGAIDLVVTNAAAPYSLNLSNGAVVVDGNQFSGLSAGAYTLTLNDANLCTVEVEFKIKEPSALSLSLSCDDGNLLANVEGGVRPYSYAWKDSVNSIFSTDSMVVFNPNQWYDFEIIDEKGCKRTDTVFLSVDFSVDKILGDVPLSVQLTNNSTDGSYSWDFDDGGTSSDENPSHEYETVGTYNLSLLLTDKYECTDQKTIVIEAQGFDLSANDWEEMYNAFSPNGDGVNDSFSFLENNAISEFSVNVYNRWGALVYSWSDPKFEWSGLSFDGDYLTQGVYYYYMSATGFDGKSYEKKGSVSLFY